MPIYGWDASHYDAVPSGLRVVSEGIKFFTHKAGGDADDAELAAWWSALKGQRDRVLLGAYWVLLPGSGAGRAQAFLARLDSQCPGWRDGPFILQLDCEIWNGDSSTKPGLGTIRDACEYLVQRAPKLRPIVYAPEWAYGDTLKGLKYPLWASSYVTGTGSASGLYPGDSSSRWGAYSGQTPAILQFTSSATIAGQTTCDANAYRGTLDQLTALLAPGWEQDMALTPDDITKVAAAVAAIPITVGTETWRLDSGAGYAARKAYEIQANLPAQLNAVTSGTTSAVLQGIPAGQPITIDYDLLAQALAKAIPAELASQLAANLAQRLQA